jgi:hypothetical protein
MCPVDERIFSKEKIMAKAIPIKDKKIVLTHPRTGREFAIDESVYEPVKAAIIQSLRGSKGKTFTELTDDVVPLPYFGLLP